MRASILVALLPILFMMCAQYGQLTPIADLPKKLNENSGMVAVDDGTVWIIEDSGNPDKIFKVDMQGKLLRELKVKNAKNEDWESLAQDSLGNLYIADIGNNSNERKDLVIYKLPNPDREKGDKIEAERIAFHYPEQKKFPPKRKDFRYNAEALFYQNGFLYIVNKDMTRPFVGEARIYRVPDKPGKYKAELMAVIPTCDDSRRCTITGADLSPDGKTLVLLSYGQIWVFRNFKGNDFTSGTTELIDLGASTQLEAVTFLDNTTLILSDEWSGGAGMNLYTFTLN
ncbi:hypothetical protein LVD13_09740 [Flavobacteriaceae bacterium D16]|nr:hypothetical protein [Flavobacteriaceae bacterium D16]